MIGVTTNGFIYRRANITLENAAGDYWKRIPGNVEKLTGTSIIYHNFANSVSKLKKNYF